MSFSKVQYEERKSRLDLQALLDTSRLLIESHDVDFVLNNLLLISMGKLMVTRSAIFWFNPRSKDHSVFKKKGTQSLPSRLTIDRTLFKINTSLFCHEHEQLKTLSDYGFSLLITIRNQERHLGFLALGPKMDGKPVSSDEIDILEGLVYMSGIAITNSELVNELRNTNRKLDHKVQELFTLFDLSKAFNTSIDRNEIKRLFKFTLLGQFFIRRFFLILKRRDNPVNVTQNGLGRDLLKEEMKKLFALEKNIIVVDDRLCRQYPFLEDLQIHLLLKLNNDGDEPAVLGLGKRANGKEFEQTDYNFLISIGNLALMSIQKTYLLEDQIEKERMEEELNIARSIQQKLLPETTPEIPELQIAAKNVPSYQVGGDYFDLIHKDDNRLTMAIADVTGKGVPASLLMANLQSVLHILQPFDIGMVEATGQINSLIYQNTPSDKFISFFWACYDANKKTLRYVNAGHNPPLLFREGSDPVTLSEGGVLLGAMPTMMPYKEGEVFLKKGDVLVLYTDGVTEAMNGQDEEFDESRLIESAWSRFSGTPDAILDGVIADVGNFCNYNFNDDLTLIVCKVD